MIEHLRAKGKEVFLTSFSHPSNALLSALGDKSHYLHFDELFDVTDLLSFLEQDNWQLTDRGAGVGMDWHIFVSVWQEHSFKLLRELWFRAIFHLTAFRD